MQKTAQKRSIINKLKEMSNVGGKAAEKFFDPEFLKVMQSLRKTDDDIRSIVAGKTIDSGSVGKDAVSLKQLLKEAKSNFNKREYMATVADLSRFNNKMKEIVNAIHTLNLNVDAIHGRFLFKGLQDTDSERFEHLRQLSKEYEEEKTKKAAAELNQYFVKEANILDWWHNIRTPRGRALAAWEKRYPKIVSKLKEGTLSVLVKAEALYSAVLSALDEMAMYRAQRNVGTKAKKVDDKSKDVKVQEENNKSYFGAAQKITNAYSTFNAAFKTYYSTEVQPWVEKLEIFKEQTAPAAQETVEKQQELEIEPGSGYKINPATVGIPTAEELKQSVDEAPDTARQNVPTGAPTATPVVQVQAPAAQVQTPTVTTVPAVTQQTPVNAPEVVVRKVKTPNPAAASRVQEGVDEAARKAQEAAAKFKAMQPKQTHVKFYETLESMSNESPIILANYITKYAKSIQLTDLETSIKLFNISKSIKG